MPEDGVQYWTHNAAGAHQFVTDLDTDDSCLLIVSTSSSNVSAAAAWPYNNVPVNTPYDYDFVNNKSDYYYVTDELGNVYGPYSEGDAYNCSELVWKAYKKAASIDLDGNGGLGVYPNDIKNSSLTFATSIGW